MVGHWSVTDSAGYVFKPQAKTSPLAQARSGQCGKRCRMFKRECLVSLINDGGSTQLLQFTKFNPADRRHFIGGSDARIIMGADEAPLVRLWREKRGEIEAENLSDNLVVQLGVVTEELNRTWYERNSGLAVNDVQERVRHPVHRWMAATLDGVVETGAVFEAKFMLPWTFAEEAAAQKHMAQLQHNMWVLASRSSVLSIITGGGKWVEIKIHADPLYQQVLHWPVRCSRRRRPQTLIEKADAWAAANDTGRSEAIAGQSNLD